MLPLQIIYNFACDRLKNLHEITSVFLLKAIKIKQINSQSITREPVTRYQPAVPLVLLEKAPHVNIRIQKGSQLVFPDFYDVESKSTKALNTEFCFLANFGIQHGFAQSVFSMWVETAFAPMKLK